jgi:PadR family transcriptional regulator, regulatory protein AphA
MDLSATARVILGMVRLGRQTGYEIKQLVDVSTRFFWAASYGQIYPELRRLEEHGLIEGDEPVAGDGRQRRPVRLTEAGERALAEWLRSGDEPGYELRDEGMLKLFFSDAMEPEERLGLVRAMHDGHEQAAARLRGIEDAARARGGGPYMTLRYGLAFHDFCAGWLAGLERELESALAERR